MYSIATQNFFNFPKFLKLKLNFDFVREREVSSSKILQNLESVAVNYNFIIRENVYFWILFEKEKIK